MSTATPKPALTTSVMQCRVASSRSSGSSCGGDHDEGRGDESADDAQEEGIAAKPRNVMPSPASPRQPAREHRKPEIRRRREPLVYATPGNLRPGSHGVIELRA